MKKLLIIVWVTVMLFVGCDDCGCDSGPYLGELKVKLTIDDENPEVLVTVFKGKIERQDTLVSEYVSEDMIYYDFVADTYYSATAHYVSDGRNIVAVDGKTMHTSTDDCDCEYAQNQTLNLRLGNW